MGLVRHFDPLGRTEPSGVYYTIHVYKLPRSASYWTLPSLARTPLPFPKSGAAHTLKLKDFEKLNDNTFDIKDLSGLPSKVIRLEAQQFPYELRCHHVEDKNRKCKEGCYVLENDGGPKIWTCESKECEGHVFSDMEVVEDEHGVCCFGQKGQRIVTLL